MTAIWYTSRSAVCGGTFLVFLFVTVHYPISYLWCYAPRSPVRGGVLRLCWYTACSLADIFLETIVRSIGQGDVPLANILSIGYHKLPASLRCISIGCELWPNATAASLQPEHHLAFYSTPGSAVNTPPTREVRWRRHTADTGVEMETD